MAAARKKMSFVPSDSSNTEAEFNRALDVYDLNATYTTGHVTWTLFTYLLFFNHAFIRHILKKGILKEKPQLDDYSIYSNYNSNPYSVLDVAVIFNVPFDIILNLYELGYRFKVLSNQYPTYYSYYHENNSYYNTTQGAILYGGYQNKLNEVMSLWRYAKGENIGQSALDIAREIEKVDASLALIWYRRAAEKDIREAHEWLISHSPDLTEKRKSASSIDHVQELLRIANFFNPKEEKEIKENGVVILDANHDLGGYYKRKGLPIKSNKFYYRAYLMWKKGVEIKNSFEDKFNFFSMRHWSLKNAYQLNEHLTKQPKKVLKDSFYREYGIQSRFIIPSLIFAHYLDPQEKEFIQKYQSIYNALQKIFGWNVKKNEPEGAHELYLEGEKLLSKKELRNAAHLFMFSAQVYQVIINSTEKPDKKMAAYEEAIKNLKRGFTASLTIYTNAKKDYLLKMAVKRALVVPDFSDSLLLKKYGDFIQSIYTTPAMPVQIKQKIIQAIRDLFKKQEGENKPFFATLLMTLYHLTPIEELNLNQTISDVKEASEILKGPDNMIAKILLERLLSYQESQKSEEKREFKEAYETLGSLELLTKLAEEKLKSDEKREEALVEFETILSKTKDNRLIARICSLLIEKRPSSLELKNRIDLILMGALARLGFSDQVKSFMETIVRQDGTFLTVLGKEVKHYLTMESLERSQQKIKQCNDLLVLDYFASYFPVQLEGLPFFKKEKSTIPERLFLSAMICLLTKNIDNAVAKFKLPKNVIEAIHDRAVKFIDGLRTKEEVGEQKKPPQKMQYQNLADGYWHAISLAQEKITKPVDFLYYVFYRQFYNQYSTWLQSAKNVLGDHLGLSSESESEYTSSLNAGRAATSTGGEGVRAELPSETNDDQPGGRASPQ